MFTVAVLFLLSVVCLNSSTALRASSVRKLWTNSVRSNVNSRGSVVYNSVFALQGSTGNTVDNIIPTECKAYADSIRSGKQISFKETIDLIDRYYQYLEVPYKCGELECPPKVNMGSAKVLSFGILNSLTPVQTLNLYGEIYRELTPDGTDHPVMRNFIKYGWEGVEFKSGLAIALK